MLRPKSGTPYKIKRRSLVSFIIGLGLSVVLVLVTLWIVPSSYAPQILQIPGHSNSANPGQIAGQTNPFQIPGHVPPKPGRPPTPSNGVSPLLFGTNLGLFDTYDQVLRSTTTRTLLQQLHVKIIRMPVRANLSEATEVQAAQAIKDLGATPLVILRGDSVDPNALSADIRIINDMNHIFGNSIVYYEYGNEEDLAGIPQDRYTASWNRVIPQLKALPLNGHFIGPINYQYDHTYLQYFLQHAQPRPDEISWHEYTCDDKWASDICISHLDNWTKHIADARTVMNATLGTTLPIMITEWNYAPNAVPNDGKNNNSAFMNAWTSKALQILAANHIFASMQYSCTNTAIPMIDGNNRVTTQGTAFQAQYPLLVGN